MHINVVSMYNIILFAIYSLQFTVSYNYRVIHTQLYISVMNSPKVSEVVQCYNDSKDELNASG